MQSNKKTFHLQLVMYPLLSCFPKCIRNFRLWHRVEVLLKQQSIFLMELFPLTDPKTRNWIFPLISWLFPLLLLKYHPPSRYVKWDTHILPQFPYALINVTFLKVYGSLRKKCADWTCFTLRVQGNRTEKIINTG